MSSRRLWSRHITHRFRGNGHRSVATRSWHFFDDDRARRFALCLQRRQVVVVSVRHRAVRRESDDGGNGGNRRDRFLLEFIRRRGGGGGSGRFSVRRSRRASSSHIRSLVVQYFLRLFSREPKTEREIKRGEIFVDVTRARRKKNEKISNTKQEHLIENFSRSRGEKELNDGANATVLASSGRALFTHSAVRERERESKKNRKAPRVTGKFLSKIKSISSIKRDDRFKAAHRTCA